jgi:leucyl/phenylalanyl-tRNA--protein transferase
MKQVLRSGKFTVTTNTCFNDVVTACSSVIREGQDGTWITDDMKAAYAKLHREGHAHSVEVWQDDALVGGLYGVHAGDVFCGESMFSLASNASKTALIWLCNTGKYASDRLPGLYRTPGKHGRTHDTPPRIYQRSA